MTVSIADGYCNITSMSFSFNLRERPATVLGACTKGYGIGTATILIGAIEDHARYLHMDGIPQSSDTRVQSRFRQMTG